uniref:Uncharacterized protein n=1 Tax=Acrobeloides nanus TaxID=290746 RepID=A0A914CNK1_9BILA
MATSSDMDIDTDSLLRNKASQENNAQNGEWMALDDNVRRRGIMLDLTKEGADANTPFEIDAEQTFDMTTKKTRAHLFIHEWTVRFDAVLNGRLCMINFNMTIRTNHPEFELDPVQLLIDGNSTWKNPKTTTG